jgi:hypothetical protein
MTCHYHRKDTQKISALRVGQWLRRSDPSRPKWIFDILLWWLSTEMTCWFLKKDYLNILLSMLPLYLVAYGSVQYLYVSSSLTGLFCLEARRWKVVTISARSMNQFNRMCSLDRSCQRDLFQREKTDHWITINCRHSDIQNPCDGTSGFKKNWQK